jgi:putative tryptophan/tyrosine transport system substrate-binding protein
VNRRDTILAMLALAATPMASPVHAQAPRRIGVIHYRGGGFNRDKWAGIAFVRAMRDLGYEEGRDYVFDGRYWDRQEQIADYARDLVQSKVDVILAASPPTIVAVKSVTDRIPIVMVYSADPVATGLVSSLGRPGGNLTGLTWDHGYETNVKSLELLKETLPKIRRVAVMWDATDTVHPIYARYFEQGAPQLGLKAVSIPVRSVEDLEAAFASMRKEKVDALIVVPSAQLTVPRREAIMALASRDRMPTLALQTAATLEFSGALLHYGPNVESTPRRAARYVHQLFKGAKPSELPVEQPDKYDLWVDLKAAQTLGVKVPQSILGRADRVIE